MIGHLLDEAVDERADPAGRRDRQEDIEQEVKVMYARGDINASTYYRLLEMAQNKQLSWDALARVRQGAQVEEPAPKTAPHRRNVEIVNSLNQLDARRTQLDQARQETESVLHSLEKDVARLQEQAKTAGEKAQGALPDEAAARAYLETKQEALERVQTLQERIAGLRQSLERSQTLRDELATREAELKALESGEHLAELEADIRGDLLEHK
jgi:predicted  nucleic acid-binding Zn-ribbon protein